MQFSEKEFLSLLTKKFRFETSAKEEKNIELFIKNHQRARERHDILTEYFFPPELVAQIQQRPKSKEIRQVMTLGAIKIKSRKRRRQVLLFVIALLALSFAGVMVVYML